MYARGCQCELAWPCKHPLPGSDWHVLAWQWEMTVRQFGSFRGAWENWNRPMAGRMLAGEQWWADRPAVEVKSVSLILFNPKFPKRGRVSDAGALAILADDVSAHWVRWAISARWLFT
jgi:hypothetical protein